MEQEKQSKLVKFLEKITSSRFLIGVVIFVFLFNFLSSFILPKSIFLVFASNIDVNLLVSLANSERRSRGLNELTVDSRLIAAAKAKGEDMMAKDYWAHYGPDGESPWQFIIAAGYDYVYAGENLAKDFSTSAPIHNAWMASPTHKSNIINSNFSNIGIAAVTGEFQGSETTLVVQMFGKLQDEYYAEENSNIQGEELPQTGPGDELEPPTITEPEDGDILSTAAFDVRGTAEEGNEIKVFDNENEIGSTNIENESFDFRKKQPYKDGDHVFFAKAYLDEKESMQSNSVAITVDTIAPVFVMDSIVFEYCEIGTLYKNYVFSISIMDNPTEVKGTYEGSELKFYKKDDKWEVVITERDNEFSDIEITAEDAAGNSAEAAIAAEELASLVNPSGATLSAKDWFIENIGKRILTRSLRGQINFFIVLVMMILLLLQQVVLARTGLTAKQPGSLLHIGVFAVLLLVGLLGGGGEIL